MKKFKVWTKNVLTEPVVIEAEWYRLMPNADTVEFCTGATSGPNVVALFSKRDIYGLADVAHVNTTAPAVADPDTGRVYEHLQLRRDQAVDESRRLQGIICDSKEFIDQAIEDWLDYLETHNPGAFNHLVNADREDLRIKIADALTAKKV